MRRLHRVRRSADGGFALPEVLFSIFLATLVLVAGSMVLLYGLRSTAFNRQSQQSADLATQGVETIRNMSYTSLSMAATDATPASDSRLVACGTTVCFTDPKRKTQEPLVFPPTGTVAGVPQHIEQISRAASNGHNGQAYTRYTYVTTPTDPSVGASYKRVTVIVDWTSYGRLHEREESTLVTLTRRGLPLPSFTWNASPPTTQLAATGAPVTFNFQLTNLGARTLFDFSASGTAVWQYYLDKNCAGSRDVLLSDTNGDGMPDLLVDAGVGAKCIIAYRTVQQSEPVGSVSYTFTATPVPDTTPTAARSAQVTLNVQQASPTVPPGYTLMTYHLGNTAGTPAANTVSQNPPNYMPFKSATSTATTLYDYSTDVAGNNGNLQGREQLQGTTGVWQYPQGGGGGNSFGGTAVLKIWAQPLLSGATSPGGFTATLQNVQKQGNGTTVTTVASSGSFYLSPWGTSSWQLVSVSLPISTPFTLKNGDSFTITINATTDMRFAYDTSQYDSVLLIGKQ